MATYQTILDQSIEELEQNSMREQPLVAGDHLTIYEQNTCYSKY